MIITCPACATRYTLADSAVGPQGRKVRCAQCGHMWWQAPEEDEPVFHPDEVTEFHPAPPPPPPKRASAAKTPAKAPADPGARRRALVGWGIFVALLAAIGAAGYFGRATAVRLWPPAALLYETVGLPVEPPGTGLQLQNVRSEQKTEDGKPVLVVDGQIVNVSEMARTVPPLRVTALGADRQPLKSWTVEPAPPQILPGEVATFRDVQPDAAGALAGVLEVMITFDGGH
ncbi:zinc-ribbon domain-containing protein [Azospirillum isscasi]|uniref:Zinc-ribbon domain-containing protein n=1 Tax=Azospirillum isscasi TaxID=3053926 RepID=A0ABU0WCU7_9PROT|nr:zinc-ribbon domain-containing protein [Azospirillum isscasi]MDQ2101912.1 zinc-ribbon domain-containing protein [Azospirillum isscasi]